MKIYLSSAYHRRLELCTYRDQLQARGHEVTSRWLGGPEQLDTDGNPLGQDREAMFERGDPAMDELRVMFAGNNVDDIADADMLILFTGGGRRGGSHVEMGIAIGLNKRLAIVGPRENVFHWLPGVRQFDGWNGLLEWLKRAP